MSVSRMLFLFYLIMINQQDRMLGKQFKEYLESNKAAQHVIVFITIFSFIVILGDMTDLSYITIYSIIIYFWYLFSTKLDIQWNMVIFIGLFIVFLYETSLINEEKYVNNDPILDGKQKNDLSDLNLNKRSILTVIMIGLTIVGIFMYNNKKQVQYGGGYDLLSFLFK